MLNIGSANETERQTLSDFCEQARFYNKHLDWRSTISWLGTDIFLTCRDSDELVSTLVCPILDVDYCWIRGFHAKTDQFTFSTWPLLLNKLEWNCQAAGIRKLYSISLSMWYSKLLEASGFITNRQIITLQKDIDQSHFIHAQVFSRIRELTPVDLIEVAKVDYAAFPPMWQLTNEDLKTALQESEHASVATSSSGEIIGYIMGSQTNASAHISRIAVLPIFQKQNVAKELLNHLLFFLATDGVVVASVNTSSDNIDAQALYKRHGFEQIDCSYPIYEKPIGLM